MTPTIRWVTSDLGVCYTAYLNKHAAVRRRARHRTLLLSAAGLGDSREQQNPALGTAQADRRQKGCPAGPA
jgi:hypothetical protein